MNFSHYFNPATTDLELYVTVSMATAEDSGWDYTEFYELSRKQNLNDFGETEYHETYDEARDRLRTEASVRVILRGNKNNPEAKTYIVTYNGPNEECGDTEDAGDVEKTITDVIYWLEKTLTEKVKDLSFENEGDTYSPAFAQFKTQD